MGLVAGLCSAVAGLPDVGAGLSSAGAGSCDVVAGLSSAAAAGSPVVAVPGLFPAADVGSKTVIIEHCNQDNLFKMRAKQVEKGLNKKFGVINFVINPVEPREGCFEVRDVRGDVFVSLLDMVPPFQELDVQDLVSEIATRFN